MFLKGFYYCKLFYFKAGVGTAECCAVSCYILQQLNTGYIKRNIIFVEGNSYDC